MPAEHADFLRKITENPEDDLPRLVYADWLEENGQFGRAEFIRLQIDMAYRSPDDPELPAMHRRANTLWYHRDPRNPFWQMPFELPQGAEFAEPVRGFVEEIICDTIQRVAQLSNELIETSPVRTLRIYHATGDRTFRKCPQLRPFSRLKLIRAGVGQSTMQSLADSPDLVHLSSLALDLNFLQTENLRQLLHSPLERQLRELWLGTNLLDDRGAELLAQPGTLANLEVLDLSGNRLSPQGETVLRQSQHWKNLRRLDLRGNHPAVYSLGSR